MNAAVTDLPLETLATELLRRAALDAPVLAIAPLPGGRNNRVHRLTTTSGSVYLLKRYFHHPADTRDRLAHEFALLRLARTVGCTRVPVALAAWPEQHAGLLSFCAGEIASHGAIGPAEIDQALAFVSELNRDATAARDLPAASEACFSISAHLATTQRRVDRLAQLTVQDDLDASAAAFIHDDLLPRWAEVRGAILTEWPTATERGAELPRAERCVSPSDFGFHNALRTADGALCFLDFEYAGWDDPAKLLCDFANQPDLLLPRPLSAHFATAFIARHTAPEALTRRAAALEPLYQLKWACICLNDFLATGRSRQRFTSGVDASAAPADPRPRQLARARTMLARITLPAPALALANMNLHHAYGHTPELC